MPDPAGKQRVWDLPTRLFHWLLVALVGFSWWSGKNHEVELHIWSGIAILTLLLFRLLWGFFGSSTARFSSFVRGPKAVITYTRDMNGWRKSGHNPLGALSVIVLLGLLSAQAVLGLFNTDEDGFVAGPLADLISLETSEVAHELHEELFNILLVFIGLHIAAVLFYRLFLGKKLIGPMISGRDAIDPDAEPMRPAKWWVAVLCLVVAVGISRWIVAGAPLP